MTHRLEARLSKLAGPATAPGQMTPAARRARIAELVARRHEPPTSSGAPEQIRRRARIAELEVKAAHRIRHTEILR